MGCLLYTSILARDAFSSNAEAVVFVEQLNKQFAIAGTSQEGIKAAMLQLTQAMGSGCLLYTSRCV